MHPRGVDVAPHLLSPDLLPSPAVGTRVGYRLLFPDTRSVGSGQDGPGRWLSKELGSVVIGATSEAEDEVNRDVLNNLQGDADKTLAEARFVIGDYISCAIFPPLANGSVAPLPPAERAGRSGGREGDTPEVGMLGEQRTGTAVVGLEAATAEEGAEEVSVVTERSEVLVCPAGTGDVGSDYLKDRVVEDMVEVEEGDDLTEQRVHPSNRDYR
ncbi:hypothetical protein H2203_002718 [Taxawa tesnikishii (nom. ined.)]|nr:hypothetical protein H2203_002718 [Dothideales sp. JES 119]